jgi:hypothetical protein
LRAVAAFVNFLSYFKSFLKKQKRAERVDGKVFPSRVAESAEYVDFPRFAAFPKYAKQANHTRLFASKQEKTPDSKRIPAKKPEKISRSPRRQLVILSNLRNQKQRRVSRRLRALSRSSYFPNRRNRRARPIGKIERFRPVN